MSQLGDLASMVATQLVTETVAPVEEAAAIAEEAALQAENSLFTKISFSWRPEDRVILERIQVAADAMFEEAFAVTIAIIDNFYAQLRVPRLDNNGMVVKDASGRTVWQEDPLTHKPIERWSQLTGQDIEMTLASLQRVKFTLVPEVNKLHLEALYARHLSTDASDEGWFSVMGTQGDRSARASRDSRVQRYHAFFRYTLYSTAKTFLDEVNAFEKILTNIRYWQIRSQNG